MNLDPKTDYGGRAKYQDINPYASDFSYEIVEDEKQPKPIFKISKKRARNDDGDLESLD